jgi:N-acetyl-gamma-glutamyl-phosphate reductase
MKRIRVFVDGQEGTTGLEIRQRLEGRDDLELLSIDPSLRKDPSERARLIRSADACFVCLPDDAARETAAMAEGSGVRLIDASTAHRVSPDWVYGLPELCPGQRERIAAADRVTVPGCHATAFALAASPLVRTGTASPDYPFSAFSITGYSGGGKKLIAEYEAPDAPREILRAPLPYALSLAHKHLPEMKFRSGLSANPVFLPVLGDYYRGMIVSLPIHPGLLARPMGAAALTGLYSSYFSGELFVRVLDGADPSILVSGRMDPQACNGTNRADIAVFGNDGEALVCVRIDNLGKGASGAAVQCLNLMFGLGEPTGLAAG